MTTLILTPTELERRILVPHLSKSSLRCDRAVERCGFGPIASAARTMQLLATSRPARVILVGIAGGLRPDVEVGTAHTFHRVRCDGIGAGTGSNYKTAAEIGWLQWSADEETGYRTDQHIGDVIDLAPSSAASIDTDNELLTVCAVSADVTDVESRLDRYPDVIAEDMEGFGVALACQLAGVTLHIVRGISNRAGDRDQKNWYIDEALGAASEMALTILST